MTGTPRAHLLLRLESPLMAFGGEAIDAHGVTRDFPAASMLTGLLANALGWERTETGRLQALQDRLVFASRITREPESGHLVDFQTAQLAHAEKGWTTRGTPEQRKGGADTFKSPHLRHRHFLADACIDVALRLEPEARDPDLVSLEAALAHPARPLFLGRKPCLPAGPILRGRIDAETALAALLAVPVEDTGADGLRVQWPPGEETAGVTAGRDLMLTDQRNWISGVHTGGRPMREARIPLDQFASAMDQRGAP